MSKTWSLLMRGSQSTRKDRQVNGYKHIINRTIKKLSLNTKYNLPSIPISLFLQFNQNLSILSHTTKKVYIIKNYTNKLRSRATEAFCLAHFSKA